MRPVRIVFVSLVAAGLCACGSSFRKEIEGNNTGGVIPPELARGANVQSLANAHCAKWGTSARITFNQPDTATDTVFVCESAPAMPPTPAAPAPDTKKPPAKKQAPRTT
jgi:hypothetical protein